MSERGFAFTRVSIRRMPGFEEGGPTVDGLSGGVNLFHGPNASGKTSLAKAVRALMWPSEAEDGWEASGRAALDGERWVIDLRGTSASYQREGNPADGSLFPSDVTADRYVLTLHELLAPDSSDAHIARKILKESTGGFDIDAAARTARFNPKPSAPVAISNKYADAVSKTADARTRQKEILDEEDTLRGLRADLDEVAEASRKCDALRAAIEYAERATTLEEAQRTLDAFDGRLAKIRGDELAAIDELANELREKREAAKRAEAGRDAALETIRGLRLPEAGVDGRSLDELRGWSSELKELKAKIENKEESYRKAKESSQSSSRRLGETADPEKLRKVDDGVVTEIGQLAAKGADLRAKRKTNETLEAWLAVEPAGRTPQQLERALEILNRWMRTPAPHDARGGTGTTVALIMACVLILGVGAFLATTSHVGYVALAIPAMAVLLPLFGGRSSADLRPGIQAEYEQTGIPGPDEWTHDAVWQTANAMGDELASVKLADKKKEFLESHKPEMAETVRLEADLRERCAQLARQVGIDDVTDEGRLYRVIHDLHVWQSNHDAAVAAERDLEAWNARREKVIGLFNERLAEFRYAPVKDATGAEAAFGDLARNGDAFGRAKVELKNAERALHGAVADAEKLEKELHAKYVAVGVHVGDRRAVEDLVARRASYREAEAARDKARTLVDSARAALHDGRALDGKTPNALRAELSELEETANKAQKIRDQITAIETRVADAKKEHAIAERLAEEQACAEELRARRTQARAQVIGSVLARRLRAQSADTGRPPVFHRAREILLGITRGRFRLEFDDGGAGGKPRFRATDTVTGRGRELGELSSGTKVQLLLAVRLAFIEEQEHGVMLPLTLDETLGNADDQRAHDIIDAVVELARRGRQVFYLTAQSDEVDKWNAALVKHPGVACRVVRLSTEGREFEAEPVEPVEVRRAPAANVPPPGGMGHAEYRAVLDVPAFDPARPTGGAHVWYLIEDVGLLHELLTGSVDTWGRLSALMSARSINPIADAGAARKVAALGRALETYVALWRRGRGRPVDEGVIVESGVFPKKSSHKKAVQLAGEVDGDAASLLNALENAGVKAITQDMVDAFRRYLIENGYLSEEPEMTTEEIRDAVTKAMQPELSGGAVSEEGLSRLLSRLAP